MEDGIAEKVEAEMRAVRAHPDQLVRYDINGNGELDADEWELVRRMIREELLTRARRDDARPTVVAQPFAVGRFEVIGLLGRGGQGFTYLATDESGERVAMKKLHLGQANDWKAVELFEREAEALRRLDHPSIPDFVDAFHLEDSGGAAFYLAQEFVFGEDLDRRLQREGPLDEGAARQLLAEVVDILEFLHSQTPPIIHRDIKPSNLIRRDDGRLVLVDFGAAQLARSTVGGSTVVGTSGYMPMEQYVGNACEASDLYALGASLVHLLSGRAPIDVPAIRMRLQFESVIDVSAHMAHVLGQLLEPHVEDRVQSVKELRPMLEESVVESSETSLIPAPETTVRTPPRKWVGIREDQALWLREREEHGGRVVAIATHRTERGWSFEYFNGEVVAKPASSKITVPFRRGQTAVASFGAIAGVFMLAAVLPAGWATAALIVGSTLVGLFWLVVAGSTRRTLLIGDGRAQVFGWASNPLFDEPIAAVQCHGGRLTAPGVEVDVCEGYGREQGDYFRNVLAEEVERIQRVELESD